MYDIDYETININKQKIKLNYKNENKTKCAITQNDHQDISQHGACCSITFKINVQ